MLEWLFSFIETCSWPPVFPLFFFLLLVVNIMLKTKRWNDKIGNCFRVYKWLQIGQVDLPALIFAWDLVACPRDHCLFLTDFTNDCVWRIIPFHVPDTSSQSQSLREENVSVGYKISSSHKNKRQLPCNPRVERFADAFGEPWTLFVSDDGELFQLWTDRGIDSTESLRRCNTSRAASVDGVERGSCEEHIQVSSTRRSVLLIYGRDGALSRATSLTEKVEYPHHVVLSTKDTLYVSHGMEDSLHRVCEVLHYYIIISL